MIKASLCFCISPITLVTFSCLYLFSDNVQAQVTADGTVNTQVNQNATVAEITGGETRGDNLFHSFQDFSLTTGNEATFNNADNIANIFSRVTGGNISNIDGLIKANGTANLFLINPAGIIFGENASLDVGGSFYASTASSILFNEGEFSATNINIPPTLTINAPIGLGFRSAPGDITNNSVVNNGRGLEVNPGENITLLGGDVNFNGGNITAPGGIVNLGGLISVGSVNFTESGNLNFAANTSKADVFLDNSAVVNITAAGGGLIAINANNLELTNNSLFLADIGAGNGSDNAVAGQIDINATRVFADNASIIQSQNLGIGKAGTININTDILDFRAGSAIAVSNFGQGEAGVVNINANNISFDQEWGGIFATTGLQRIQTLPLVSQAFGNAGLININTDTLDLTNGAQVQVNSVAQGNAGNINIQAAAAVNFIGKGKTAIADFGGGTVISGVLSQVRGNSSGDAGQVTINAGSLNLIDKGAIIVNSSSSESNAGNIDLNVQGLTFLKDEGLILSQTGEGGIGEAGNINIKTGSLQITDSSFILADSYGRGNSGNITIDATDAVVLKGFRSGIPFPSQIVNQLTGTAEGKAGDITINARELIMEDVSFISSSNGIETIGSAGNININVQSLEISENAFINAFTNNNSNAGVVNINAQTLNLLSGGKIIAATDGGGNAGNIAINMSGELKIDSSTKYDDQTVDFAGISPLLNELQQSPSGIYADATAKARGSGGNILINSDSILLNNDGIISAATSFGEGGNIILKLNNDLTLDNNSTISARAFEQAKGGNVKIDSRFIIAFPNSNNDIIASAAEGEGGDINVNAESLFGIEKRQLNPQTNDINASSNVVGLDGTVIINTPDLSPVQRVIELTNNIIEPGQTTEQACQANREASAKNELTIKGKGGVPTAPDQPLISQNTLIDGEINVSSATIEPIETNVGKIQLARGITVKENGQVILTAYPTNDARERIPQVKINCGQI